MKHLQLIKVKKDDVLIIEVGTVHAIGAGALVAEIQENSNLTYRLYDYARVSKDGKNVNSTSTKQWMLQIGIVLWSQNNHCAC